jgi:hypothetical protein
MHFPPAVLAGKYILMTAAKDLSNSPFIAETLSPQVCGGLSVLQDAEDLAALEERANEPLIAFEDVLKALKGNNQL